MTILPSTIPSLLRFFSNLSFLSIAFINASQWIVLDTIRLPLHE